MTPVSRKRPVALALGLPVLAVIFSSAGLVAPATAASDVPVGPGTSQLPDSPLAATLSAKSTKVVTGKKVTLSGTSPSLAGLGLPLPVPVPKVAIQRSVAGGAYEKLEEVSPESDGSFSLTTTQDRSTSYRAVPIAPVGELVTVLLPDLVSSAPVDVASQGTVSMTAKRTAKRTYVFSGKATPGTAGQAVTLLAKKGKTYKPVASTTTAADGAYSVRSVVAKGKRSFRVVTATTPDALGASSTRVVRIR